MWGSCRLLLDESNTATTEKLDFKKSHVTSVGATHNFIVAYKGEHMIDELGVAGRAGATRAIAAFGVRVRVTKVPL
jgi:hypothetical protein